VETMNSACKRFWGYDPKDIVGKSIADLASEEEQENLARLLRKAFAGDTEPFELVMRYADGRTRDTSWTARLLPSSGLLACVVHDISDSKQLERLKLQFGGLVRENLRGPLHSMKDIVDAVEARSKSISPQIEQSLHSTGVEINRLIGLVDRLALLHFADGAGAMPTNRESLSPKDLIAAAKSSVMAVAQKQNIEIAVAPCPSSVISGNRDDLVRVLVNLLGNAIKFSPEASTIVVACRDEDNSCVFQVVDQGPGIPLEFRRTIFEQFSQVTGSKSTVEQGTGLGLAVCKQVIIGHGGDIGVDCPANGGSTFWFRLPRSSSEIRS
jgi:two-component system, OmpR family, sensor histidine kinase VicK